jgi:hypothetical protein
VRLIRVTHYGWVGASSPPRSHLDVQQEVRKVWSGKFQHVACAMMWAEGGNWNIKATIEFDDGKSGSLMTDGMHVQFQDRNGKYWFIRLRPAVD